MAAHTVRCPCRAVIKIGIRPGGSGRMAGRTLPAVVARWAVFLVAALAVGKAAVIEACLAPAGSGCMAVGTLACIMIGWSLAGVAALAVCRPCRCMAETGLAPAASRRMAG